MQSKSLILGLDRNLLVELTSIKDIICKQLRGKRAHESLEVVVAY